jgi:hypothetical protein
MQAAEVETPKGQNILQRGRWRAQSAWYSAKYGCQRAGHVLMGWLSAAWLWLGQAWDRVAEWGRAALRMLEHLRLWLAGCLSHAAQSVQGIWHRPSPA